MNDETEEILTIVAEKAQLAEGIEGVRSILLTMYRFPSLKNKKVSQKTGIAIPPLAAVRGELVKAGILEKKEKFLENRPKPDFALDQSHAISSTVVRRALYLLKKGDIEGRKILFLGDDDATSLAVGLLNLAEEITVIDIDPNVIKFLSEGANTSCKRFKQL